MHNIQSETSTIIAIRDSIIAQARVNAVLGLAEPASLFDNSSLVVRFMGFTRG